VKFGGSNNPAGRAHKIWELNAIQFSGSWNQSDKELGSCAIQDSVKDYLDTVLKIVVTKYGETFPWGKNILVEESLHEIPKVTLV